MTGKTCCNIYGIPITYFAAGDFSFKSGHTHTCQFLMVHNAFDIKKSLPIFLDKGPRYAPVRKNATAVAARIASAALFALTQQRRNEERLALGENLRQTSILGRDHPFPPQSARQGGTCSRAPSGRRLRGSLRRKPLGRTWEERAAAERLSYVGHKEITQRH